MRKKLTNKEIQEKLNNLPKPKYLYQRYNGEIRKHEIVNDRFLVDVKTGISIDFIDNIILGKVSENLIDLIEVGDYVNGCLVEAIDYEEDEETGGYYNVLGIWEREDDFCYGIELSKLPIRAIVTKEQFKSIEFKVVEDD